MRTTIKPVHSQALGSGFTVDTLFGTGEPLLARFNKKVLPNFCRYHLLEQ
jgi:hypothetical protein